MGQQRREAGGRGDVLVELPARAVHSPDYFRSNAPLYRQRTRLLQGCRFVRVPPKGGGVFRGDLAGDRPKVDLRLYIGLGQVIP